jgi:hypothetical protein
VYHPATLEAYFAREIRERVGPFVALGDPDDYVPSVGAAREYVDDHGWRQVFEDLARRSQFMLMRPEASDNLLAEVRWLDAEALLGKLCVVTSAARERRFFPRPWGRGWERRRWSGFAAALHSIGLDLGPYPGRGAVVSFDPGGTPVRVAAGAQSPAQYVEAIQRWRASGVESDAGAPVSRGDRVTGRPPGSPAAERPR